MLSVFYPYKYFQSLHGFTSQTFTFLRDEFTIPASTASHRSLRRSHVLSTRQKSTISA